jgi:hypothetical protein
LWYIDLDRKGHMYALNYLKFSRLPVQVVQVVAVPLMKKTERERGKGRGYWQLRRSYWFDRKISKGGKGQDCDKMKVAKGKVSLYLTCICFGIRWIIYCLYSKS